MSFCHFEGRNLRLYVRSKSTYLYLVNGKLFTYLKFEFNLFEQNLADYKHQYWLPAEKEGYSGVALLSREKPLDVTYGFDDGPNVKVLT